MERVILLASVILVAPVSHYSRQIEGWQVQVDRRLFDADHRALGARSMRLLGNQLLQISDLVPAKQLSSLRKVTIWLELNNKDLERPQYHPSSEWLKQNGFNVQMAKGVHIPIADYFAKPSFQSAQPYAVLHEMAHAYHDQVLGFEDETIKAAWKKFAADPRHESVLRYSGRMEKHYGTVNQMEYFAEMTESYFGTNDFFPFVRAELQREEPEAFTLMQSVWRP